VDRPSHRSIPFRHRLARQANERSIDPTVSADGRFVAFVSWATNLVPRDSNGMSDIFVRDRVMHTTILVSVSSAEQQADGESSESVISGNGRFVAFKSKAHNLVSPRRIRYETVYLRDLALGTTEMVVLSSRGERGNGRSWDPGISDDGRYVSFTSDSTNLGAGNASGAYVYVRDRRTGKTELISDVPNGGFGPKISGTGRYVGFTVMSRESESDYRFDTHIFDRTSRTQVVTRTGADHPHGWSLLALSPDGRVAALESFDEDHSQTIHTWRIGEDRIEEIASVCLPLPPCDQCHDWKCYRSAGFSGDGRYMAFAASTPVVGGDDNACYPWDRPGECPDVYLLDRSTGKVTLQSRTPYGQGNFGSWGVALSRDGRLVVFQSMASNLVPHDSNRCDHSASFMSGQNCDDVLVRDVRSGRISRASVE
jgi:Tol biopolymer transport system component